MNNVITQSGDTVHWYAVAEYSRSRARAVVDRVDELLADRVGMPNYLLVDVTEATNADAGARLEYARFLKRRPFDAIAICGTTTFTRTLSTVIFKLGQFSNVEFADNVREGAQWLTRQGATGAESGTTPVEVRHE